MTPEESAYLAAVEAENDELRERITQLEDALGMNVTVPLMFDITRSEQQLLGLLMERELVTKDLVMLALYGLRPEGGAEPKIVDVFCCKLRKKLKAWNIEIKTAWGRGYYLEESEKAKIRALLPKAKEAA